MLFSGGKDSLCMLHVARKAFWPGKIPFPLLHVDTGHNFPEPPEFRAQLIAEFGESILAAPRFTGMGAMTYVAPFAALLLGLGGLALFLNRQRKRKAAVPVDAIVVDESLHPEDAATRERLERELRSHLGN